MRCQRVTTREACEHSIAWLSIFLAPTISINAAMCKVILSLCQPIADSDTLFLEEQLKGQRCNKFATTTKTWPGVIGVIAPISQGSERPSKHARWSCWIGCDRFFCLALPNSFPVSSDNCASQERAWWTQVHQLLPDVPFSSYLC